MGIVQKLSQGLQKRKLKSYDKLLHSILSISLSAMSDQELKDQAKQLREQAHNGVPADELLVEAYAVVVEAVQRVMGVQLFNEQIIAGLAMHGGKLIEMQTGEGKTLAAVLPAYLHALSGHGVHILTFNDYLARRDALWMGPIYEYLGLTVGYVEEGMDGQARKIAYSADVTYLTAKEAGFDFLRDSIVREAKDIVQRAFHFVIVDEADSILIDEARTPLVIAGEREGQAVNTGQVIDLVNKLSAGIDYDTDEYQRNVFLTEHGSHKAESILGCGNLYEDHNIHLLTSIHCALYAEALLQRDVDYIVRDGKLELIDELTGRVAENRHYPDAIQSAVEAKEGITQIRKGGAVLGMITLQHLIGMYPAVTGMTATAQSSADEFYDTYYLEVVTIPPHRPCIRLDEPHLIYTHKLAKYEGLAQEIASVHRTGRPILIGTASVEESAMLTERLLAENVNVQVLNAKNDLQEAQIIALAGKLGAVTVSTNMAGRGVDIVLGGGDEAENKRVMELGGLYVIGTNIHESPRIDNQLRGRAGRQGDPGTTRFYLSLEDDLIVQYGVTKAVPEKFRGIRQDQPLAAPVVNRTIMHIQRVINGQNFALRKNLNKYADLLDEQRKMIYEKRTNVLLDRNNEYVTGIEEQLASLPADDVRKLTLTAIDKCWMEHLDFVNYVKEGIHLVGISHRNPEDEYNSQLIGAFHDLGEKIQQEMLTLLANFDSLSDERGPIWTYVIYDQLFEKKMSMI